jgi:hypothetical protein
MHLSQAFLSIIFCGHKLAFERSNWRGGCSFGALPRDWKAAESAASGCDNDFLIIIIIFVCVCLRAVHDCYIRRDANKIYAPQQQSQTFRSARRPNKNQYVCACWDSHLAVWEMLDQNYGRMRFFLICERRRLARGTTPLRNFNVL